MVTECCGVQCHCFRCDLRIVSDANRFFIEAILECHGLLGCFSQIVTNPTSVEQDGRLRIFPHCDLGSSFHGCNLCPPNLCKVNFLYMPICICVLFDACVFRVWVSSIFSLYITCVSLVSYCFTSTNWFGWFKLLFRYKLRTVIEVLIYIGLSRNMVLMAFRGLHHMVWTGNK